uniref:RNA-dependent RNA polymerase n=1 Tax=Ziziphus jujuba TaxID=326968 RepID=A0A6P6GIP9_ZIZJJ
MGKTIRLHGFSGVENPKDVVEFLEAYTGEGTVYAVEVGQYKNQRRAFAKVQFTSEESAEIIMDLAADQDERLWYGGDSYLQARELNLDIEKKPKVFAYSMDDVKLHFGGQISEDKFSVLWKKKNVSVKFGMGIRNFYFFFSYLSVEYKLEVPSESIWKIELRRPRGQATKFLLIQLIGAPKIYEKDVPIVNYFKEAPNRYWVREVDFTPSSSIGQSSAICLELPYRCQLPDLRDHFIYYKEEEGHFELQKGDSFSHDSNLVPLVDPPPGIDLPYKILFKVNSLVQHGCLPGQALDINFFRLVDPTRINIHSIECALNRLYHLKECCYDPVKWLKEQYRKNLSNTLIPQVPYIVLDEGLVYVYRVQVTPSKVYFCGPEINLSNRVLRNYPEDIDNFLRVSFVDEDLGSIYSTDLSPRTTSADDEERRTGIYERILSVLKDGIVIGDKKFEFLAFSSSQLKDNSVWMFASRPGLNAEDIREWMGDFRHIRNVAKYAARLGQSFSSSRETLSVFHHEREIIPDIEVEKGGVNYCFSDGIGKISAEFAERVAGKCSISYTPSAFQIRYGGYKGVVAIDPTSFKKLSLRESMGKYKSKNIKLDVLSWSSYHPCFLNRQIVTLLSTLGVKDRVFEKKQKEAINQLEAILTDPLRARQGLELMFPGENTNILKEMLVCGYKPDSEPFLSLMLQTLCASKLLELRTKTRIYIPNGRSVIGCLDETGTLEYGQVFVKCSSRKLLDDSSFMFSSSSSREDSFVVRGKVVVAKNPCLHPGDVRVLRAVDVPALHHIVDCVVFPQKGKRPHPNECSGSDLDGDIYFVCWDPDLIPPQQIDPMDYTPAPITELDHDVTMEDVEEYFTNFMVNDVMGIIANAHTVFADSSMKKAKSDSCLKLAELFSIAVDFPKTGVPAKIPRRLRVKEYPDFMEKADKPTYESKQVIGKLFRQVKDVELHTNSIKSFTEEVAAKYYDPEMEVDGFQEYVDDAFKYKTEYDYKLGNLMDYYGFKTEAELLTGNVIGISKFFDKKRDLESVNYAVKSLRKEARTWFNDEGKEESVNYAKASAWYYVTYHPSCWGCYNKGMKTDHFLSFPWCVYDKLIMIKKNKMSKTRLHMSSLESHRLGLLSL